MLDIEEELPTCIACQYRKQIRLPFPQNKTWKGQTKTTIGTHRCWMSCDTLSLNGSKYYIFSLIKQKCVGFIYEA